MKIKRITKDSTKKILYFSIILLLACAYLCYRFFKRDSLYKKGIIESAYIYEINHGSPKGGNIVIKYYFLFKGTRYFGGIDSGLPYSIKSKLLNNYFPVLIDTTNPKNNVLLVDMKRWKHMNKQFPDSLNWIKQYY